MKLVLIDTVGRGQRDEAHPDRDASGARACERPDLSGAFCNQRHRRHAGSRPENSPFLNPDRWILTKTDEAVRFGNCVNLCVRVGLPIAYFTTGQRVPEDIQPADARWLACKVLADLSECTPPTRPLAFAHQEEV